MKSYASVWVTFACLLATGCATPKSITTDFDNSVDFSKFRTFSWIDPHPLIRSATQRPLSPLVERRLMSNTRDLLTSQGFRFEDNPADADLVVAFTIGSRDGIVIETLPTRSFNSSARRQRPGGWRGYWTGNTVSTRQYTEGQLAVDIFDVAEARPVWHGSAGRQITRSDREVSDELVREALEAILADFPPG